MTAAYVVYDNDSHGVDRLLVVSLEAGSDEALMDLYFFDETAFDFDAGDGVVVVFSLD